MEEATLFQHLCDLEYGFDDEVTRLLERESDMEAEEAHYLVTVRRLHGYPTHVYI